MIVALANPIKNTTVKYGTEPVLEAMPSHHFNRASSRKNTTAKTLANKRFNFLFVIL